MINRAWTEDIPVIKKQPSAGLAGDEAFHRLGEQVEIEGFFDDTRDPLFS